MLSTLMIVSKDQGKLNGAPRAIGQLDERLLIDIGYRGREPLPKAKGFGLKDFADFVWDVFFAAPAHRVRAA